MKKYLILVSILFLSACAGTKKTVVETRNKVYSFKITDTVKLQYSVKLCPNPLTVN